MTDRVDADGDDPAAWWNEVYESDAVPPWDIGEPQPALADAIEREGLAGRVLDVGCGTGTHALWAADRGYSAVGVDVSEKGIELARAKARARELDVEFRVANALNLPDGIAPFDTVLDSGLFHAFDAGQRERYARELAHVLSADGRVFLVGFADGAPDDWGPNPFGPDDVRSAFRTAWDVTEVRDVAFETREASVPGLLAVVERV